MESMETTLRMEVNMEGAEAVLVCGFVYVVVDALNKR